MSAPRLPLYGWVGIAWMAAAQILLVLGNAFVATWLTPLMWTGYILALDGVVHVRGGRSWLIDRRREFPLLLLLSVAVWLGFEAFNLHLKNWAYRGLPADPWLRDLGYFWSFATIMPGVFVTGSLFETLSRRPTLETPPSALGPLSGALAILIGAAMVAVPLLVPGPIAAYLFGSVWIGFILLVEPINARWGVPSLWARWRAGDRTPVVTLLLGGLVCGFLWEAWNGQALQAGGGHWVYTIPDRLRVLGLHFGQMPVLGLLGFPPFALELFALYHFLRRLLGGDRIFGPAGLPSARS